MKNIKFLINVLIVIIISLISCQKNSTVKQTTESQDSKASTQESVIKQKTYNLTSEELFLEIKKFKGLQSNVYVPVDSAQWILEATLNSDFDSTKTQSDIIFRDSLSIELQTSNNNMINSTDLQLAYKNLHNQISQKISNTDKFIYVYLVDIYAIRKNQNSIILKVNLIAFVSQTSHKISTITSSAIWSTTESNFNLLCNPSGPDAAVQVNAELNLNIPHGGRNCYWVNLSTYSYNNSSGSYSSYLFYWTTYNSSNICTNPAITLSVSQQNAYVSSAYSLANSVVYWGQPDFADFKILPYYQIGSYNYTSPYKLYWNLNFTKGQFICP